MFRRESSLASKTVVVIAGAFAVLTVALAVALCAVDYRATVRQTDSRNDILAQAIEEHVRRSFDINKVLLQQIVERLEAGQPVDDAFAADLRRITGDFPQLSSLFVIDRAGRPLLTTAEGTPPPDVSDREYFQAHQGGVDLHIGGLTRGRTTGKWFFYLSKRVTNREGGFDGLVLAATNVEFYHELFTRLGLGERDNIGIYRLDGTMVVRRTLPEGDVAPRPSNAPLFSEHLRKAPHGHFDAVSVVDGLERLVSYRTVEGWPLVVVASAAKADVLRPWQMRTGIIAAFLAVLLGVAGLLVRARYRGLKHEEAVSRKNAVLLNEVHHRVKNNLAIIQSLLMLEAGKAPAHLRAGYDDSIARVETMGLVHRMLYQSQSFSGIDGAAYLAQFCAAVAATAPNVRLNADVESVEIELDQAVPLALILNEVVTNAIKYGFPDGAPGTITVRLRGEGGEAVVEVRDNGRGYPEGFTLEAGNGLGLMLVRQLTGQLNGQARAGNEDGGAVFTLRFPLARGN